MGRYPQSSDGKGSLKWTQELINERPDLLNSYVKATFSLEGSEEIEWVSPLKDDDYAEYRDADFLQRLGITIDKRPLKEFWPNRGPQWDALGRTNKGKCFLVEAKAHVEEIVSSPTGAEGKSLSMIQSALNETKKYLNSKSTADWSLHFYQYTNRLAHLYFLRELNNIPVFLVFVYFLNDASHIPTKKEEWDGAIKQLHSTLGTGKHKLKKYVLDIFIDVGNL
jgi:hypothetical protein